MLPIKDIKPNPSNPRLIKDDKFQKLVQSLKDFPEMATVRPVVVNKAKVILGGNMRYRAAKEAGWAELPVTVVDWPEAKQREFMIKDNVSGGEWDWDVLTNEWDQSQLVEWDVPRVDVWTPNFNPDSGLAATTDAEVAKKEAQLLNAFGDNGQPKQSVVCPYCAEEFYVNK